MVELAKHNNNNNNNNSNLLGVVTVMAQYDCYLYNLSFKPILLESYCHPHITLFLIESNKSSKRFKRTIIK